MRARLVARANMGIGLALRNRPGDRQEAVRLLRLAWADARRLRIPEARQIEDILRQLGEEP